MESFIAYYNYIAVVILLMLGLWAMIAKKNLVKKLIGMSIFQTAIILFYISMGTKKGSNIPILDHGHGDYHDAHHAIDATLYANPLTHILMLTAIVVGVATLGLALTTVINVYKEYNTLDEDEINELLTKENQEK